MSVDDDMARKLERVAKRHAKAQRERDRLIFEAVKVGGSLREVGELVDLSHTAVWKIVDRQNV